MSRNATRDGTLRHAGIARLDDPREQVVEVDGVPIDATPERVIVACSVPYADGCQSYALDSEGRRCASWIPDTRGASQVLADSHSLVFVEGCGHPRAPSQHTQHARVIDLDHGHLLEHRPLGFPGWTAIESLSEGGRVWATGPIPPRLYQGTTLRAIGFNGGASVAERELPFETKEMIVGAGRLVCSGTYTVFALDSESGDVLWGAAAWAAPMIASDARRLVLWGSNGLGGDDLVRSARSTSMDELVDFSERAGAAHWSRADPNFSVVSSTCVRDLDTGEICWTGGEQPHVAAGSLLIGATDATLIARDLSDGALRWSLALPGGFLGARAGGDVLHVSCGSSLLAIDLLTGEVLWDQRFRHAVYGFAWTAGRLFVESGSESVGEAGKRSSLVMRENSQEI